MTKALHTIINFTNNNNNSKLLSPITQKDFTLLFKKPNSFVAYFGKCPRFSVSYHNIVSS